METKIEQAAGPCESAITDDRNVDAKSFRFQSIVTYVAVPRYVETECTHVARFVAEQTSSFSGFSYSIHEIQGVAEEPREE